MIIDKYQSHRSPVAPDEALPPPENLRLKAFINRIKNEPFVRAFEAFTKPFLQRGEGVRTLEKQNAEIRKELKLNQHNPLTGYYSSIYRDNFLGGRRGGSKTPNRFRNWLPRSHGGDSIFALPLVMSEPSLKAFVELLSMDITQTDFIEQFSHEPAVFNWASHCAAIFSFDEVDNSKVPEYVSSLRELAKELKVFFANANDNSPSGQYVEPIVPKYLYDGVLLNDPYYQTQVVPLSSYAPRSFQDLRNLLGRDELPSSAKDKYIASERKYEGKQYLPALAQNPQTDATPPLEYARGKAAAEYVSVQQYNLRLKEVFLEALHTAHDQLKNTNHSIFIPQLNHELIAKNYRELYPGKEFRELRTAHLLKMFERFFILAGLQKTTRTDSGYAIPGYEASEANIEKLISLVTNASLNADDDEHSVLLSLYSLLKDATVIDNNPGVKKQGEMIFPGKKVHYDLAVLQQNLKDNYVAYMDFKLSKKETKIHIDADSRNRIMIGLLGLIILYCSYIPEGFDLLAHAIAIRKAIDERNPIETIQLMMQSVMTSATEFLQNFANGGEKGIAAGERVWDNETPDNYFYAGPTQDYESFIAMRERDRLNRHIFSDILWPIEPAQEYFQAYSLTRVYPGLQMSYEAIQEQTFVTEVNTFVQDDYYFYARLDTATNTITNVYNELPESLADAGDQIQYLLVNKLEFNSGSPRAGAAVIQEVHNFSNLGDNDIPAAMVEVQRQSTEDAYVIPVWTPANFVTYNTNTSRVTLRNTSRSTLLRVEDMQSTLQVFVVGPYELLYDEALTVPQFASELVQNEFLILYGNTNTLESLPFGNDNAIYRHEVYYTDVNNTAEVNVTNEMVSLYANELRPFFAEEIGIDFAQLDQIQLQNTRDPADTYSSIYADDTYRYYEDILKNIRTQLASLGVVYSQDARVNQLLMTNDVRLLALTAQEVGLDCDGLALLEIQIAWSYLADKDPLAFQALVLALGNSATEVTSDGTYIFSGFINHAQIGFRHSNRTFEATEGFPIVMESTEENLALLQERVENLNLGLSSAENSFLRSIVMALMVIGVLSVTKSVAKSTFDTSTKLTSQLAQAWHKAAAISSEAFSIFTTNNSAYLELSVGLLDDLLSLPDFVPAEGLEALLAFREDITDMLLSHAEDLATALRLDKESEENPKAKDTNISILSRIRYLYGKTTTKKLVSLFKNSQSDSSPRRFKENSAFKHYVVSNSENAVQKVKQTMSRLFNREANEASLAQAAINMYWGDEVKVQLTTLLQGFDDLISERRSEVEDTPARDPLSPAIFLQLKPIFEQNTIEQIEEIKRVFDVALQLHDFQVDIERLRTEALHEQEKERRMFAKTN